MIKKNKEEQRKKVIAAKLASKWQIRGERKNKSFCVSNLLLYFDGKLVHIFLSAFVTKSFRVVETALLTAGTTADGTIGT